MRILMSSSSSSSAVASLSCTQCFLPSIKIGDRRLHPSVADLELHRKVDDDQKLDSWKEKRHQSFSSTYLSKTLPRNHPNVNPYTTLTTAFLDKLGLAVPFEGNEATRHGDKFENIAIEVYKACVNNTNVNSYGLLQHRYIDFIGGSPDGILDTGVGLEVKCPFYRYVRREDRIPAYYYP